MRVLIADDSEVLVDRLATTLTKVIGIEVVGRAGPGEATLKATRKLKPDVLILDICMPGGSSIAALDRMRADEFAPAIIVLTNYSFSQYTKRCLQKGAKYVLAKSTEFEKVSEVLKRLISAGMSIAAA